MQFPPINSFFLEGLDPTDEAKVKTKFLALRGHVSGLFGFVLGRVPRSPGVVGCVLSNGGFVPRRFNKDLPDRPPDRKAPRGAKP